MALKQVEDWYNNATTEERERRFGGKKQNGVAYEAPSEVAAEQTYKQKIEQIEVKSNGVFGMIGEPHDHKQHPAEQNGLDLYVTLINFQTGERCHKKLDENTKGLHCKHTGFPPMYLRDFNRSAVIVPFQVHHRDLHEKEPSQ